ncbi:MAG: M56 family metallopeptidase [Puia sp.]|nr:M56 family metallopeptidase [Puia sp.]
MHPLLLYMAKSLLVSGILLGYYRLFLRDKPFHRFNRFFLLGILAASVLIPLVKMQGYNYRLPDWWANSGLANGRPGVGPAATGRLSNASKAGSAHFSAIWAPVFQGVCSVLPAVLQWVYLSGLIYCIVRFVRRFLPVRRILRTHTRIRHEGFYLIETSCQGAPFTFLQYLFWLKGLSPEGEAGRKIWEHERAHIRQGHSYDQLAALLAACFFWYNPFSWMIRRELDIVHEFLADEQSIAPGDTASLATLLLTVYSGGTYLPPGHAFGTSPVHRRLAMIRLEGELSTVQAVRKRMRRMHGLLIPALITILTLSLAFSTISGAPPGADFPAVPPNDRFAEAGSKDQQEIPGQQETLDQQTAFDQKRKAEQEFSRHHPAQTNNLTMLPLRAELPREAP